MAVGDVYSGMAERHEIPVEDDEGVVAVHHKAPSARWLVFCHGFRSDKSGSYEGRCERAVAEGYNAIRFDFRGCGEADGEFVEQTLTTRLADLEAVVDHFDLQQFWLFGSSFGGKVAFHTAVRDDRVAALATRAPVTYGLDLGDRREIIEEEGVYRYDSGHAIDERLYEDMAQYAFADVASVLDVPVAVFHGAADAKIPLKNSFEAAAELNVDVMVQKLAGEGHLFSESAEDHMRDQLFDWLARV